MKALLGTKIGMTQIWDDKGRLVGATVVHIQPNRVLKSANRAHLATAVAGKTNKAQAKVAQTLNTKRGVWLKEISADNIDQDQLTVEIFTVGEKVKVSGVTKGKGFAGGMKRHGFHGGPKSHGSDHQRTPGSIGAQRPQRVPKGQKMAGHMGHVNFTARGGQVLAVNAADNLLIISGAVPGPNKGRVIVQAQ